MGAFVFRIQFRQPSPPGTDERSQERAAIVRPRRRGTDASHCRYGLAYARALIAAFVVIRGASFSNESAPRRWCRGEDMGY